MKSLKEFIPLWKLIKEEKVKLIIASSLILLAGISEIANILKNIGIAACILLSTSGVVFATNMIINKFLMKIVPTSVIMLINSKIEQRASL